MTVIIEISDIHGFVGQTEQGMRILRTNVEFNRCGTTRNWCITVSAFAYVYVFSNFNFVMKTDGNRNGIALKSDYGY